MVLGKEAALCPPAGISLGALEPKKLVKLSFGFAVSGISPFKSLNTLFSHFFCLLSGLMISQLYLLVLLYPL